MKKRKTILWVSVAVAAALLLGAGIPLALHFLRPTAGASPLANSLNAVLFPDAPLSDRDKKGGTVTLQVDLGADVIGALGQNQLPLSLTFDFGEDGNLHVRGAVHAGTAEYGIDLLSNPETGESLIHSDFVDDGVKISRKNLKEQLDASVLAPDSGSSFSLPQELYDFLLTFEKKEEEDDGNFKESVFRPIADTVRAGFSAEKTEGKYQPLHAPNAKSVDTVTMTANPALPGELAKALRRLWQENGAFRSAVGALLSPGDADTAADAFDKLTERLEKCSGDRCFRAEIRMHVLKNYCVGLCAEAVITDPDTQEKAELCFELGFPEKPEKDRCFRLTGSVASANGKVSLRADWNADGPEEGKTVFSFDDAEEPLLSVDLHLSESAGESGTEMMFVLLEKASVYDSDSRARDFRASWTVKAYGPDGAEEADATEAVLEGERYTDGSRFSVLSARFGVGEDTVEYKKSRLTVLVSPGEHLTDGFAGQYRGIAELSESDVDGLVAARRKKISALAPEFNKALGAELLIPSCVVEETQRTEIDPYAAKICYDASTDRLFVLTPTAFTSSLSVYDGKTLSKIATREFDTVIRDMDSDAGRFAYAAGNEFKIYFLDQNTLEQTDVLDWPENDFSYRPSIDYIGNLYLDGDTLILTKRDQWCNLILMNIRTGETRMPNSFYRPNLAFNREHHVIALMETNSSDASLYLYNSLTGEMIPVSERVRSQYGAEVPFDFGAGFLVNETYVGMDGTVVPNLGKLIPELPPIRGWYPYVPLYVTDRVTIALDMSGDGYTAFYDKRGQQIRSFAELFVMAIPGRDGVLYCVAAGADSLSLRRYETADAVQLDLDSVQIVF